MSSTRGKNGTVTVLRARLRIAAARLAAGVLVLALAEAVLIAAGMPGYHQLVDQSSAFPPEERAVAAELKQHYQQPGRGFRVAGTTLWLYRPFRSPHLQINSLGLRGPEVKPRQQGELRLAMLGGSAVYGWLVAEENTIPSLLQAALQDRYPGRRVTVCNLGVEGYRFQQELELLHLVLDQVDPDLLVFYHGGNDILTAALQGRFQLTRLWAGDQEQDAQELVVHYQYPGLAWKLRQAVKHSRLCTTGLLARLWLAAGDEPLEKPLPPHLQALADELVAGYQDQLDQLWQLSQDRSLQAVIFLQPLIHARTDPTFAERVRRRRSEAEAEHLGLLWHTTTRRLEQLSSEALPVHDLRWVVADDPATLFQDWAHLSPRGNRLIAEAIAADLQSYPARLSR